MGEASRKKGSSDQELKKRIKQLETENAALKVQVQKVSAAATRLFGTVQEEKRAAQGAKAAETDLITTLQAFGIMETPKIPGS